jgi:hypothetical protein
LWPTSEDLVFRPGPGDSRIEADTHGLLVLRRPVRPSSLEVCNVAAQSPVEMAFHHGLKVALAQLSESGTLLGWIAPIENKYELPGVESGHGRH